MLDAKLEQAYRNTRYIVDAPGGPIVLRIGEHSAALDALLAELGVTCWTFITASNPRSVKSNNKINNLRNDALSADLRRAGYAVFTGRGVADAGDWPAEYSVLVPGMAAADAVQFGARYGQYAVVTGNLGECAVLRWCTG